MKASTRQRWLDSAILTVGIVAVLLPVAAAYQIANGQIVRDEKLRVETMAQELVKNNDETATQIARARNQLNSGIYGAPCSEGELNRMRGLTLGSTRIQGVGRITGDQIDCSSFGQSNPPIRLGPPSMVTKGGVRLWLYVELREVGGNTKFHVAESEGVFVFVAPDLDLEVFSEFPDTSFAIVSAATRAPISLKGPFDPSWLDRIDDEKPVSFEVGDQVVGLYKSKVYDTVGVVTIPHDHSISHATDHAIGMLPFALIAGVLSALSFRRFAKNRLSMPNMLRSAVRNREFFLHFQPVVELATGRTVGCEALLRWQRDGEMIRPDRFIPIAEESGVIREISFQVIEMAMEAASRLLPLFPDGYLGLNLSSSDILSGKIPEKLKAEAERCHVDLHSIGVEVTETGLLEGSEAVTMLDQIRSTGVRMVMDDFGTGYSSLAYLMNLEVDVIKIDKLFVDAIGTDAATAPVVDHMIGMADTLQKNVIAEGIENATQAEYLKERGVRFGQGYFFGKPMPLEELLAKLEAPGSKA